VSFAARALSLSLILVAALEGRALAQGWYAVSTTGLADELTTIAMSHRNPNFVLVGTVRGRILRTLDGGSTWEELRVATDRSVYYGRERQPDPSWEYAPGLPGKSPYLQSWLRRSGLATSGINMAQLLSEKAERSVAINWIEVDWHDESTIYVGMGFGLYRSRDKGRSFMRIFQGQKDAADRNVNTVATDPSDPRRILVGTSNGLFLSSDRGFTFEKTMNYYMRDSYIREIWFVPNQPKVVHVAMAGSAMASTDSGVHWQTTHWNDWAPRSDVQSFSIGPGDLRLIGTRDGVFASWQGGEGSTWQRRGWRFSGMQISKVLASANPSVWYATTDGAVWVTEDSGLNWRKVFQAGGREVPRWITAFGGERRHLWMITNRQVYRIGPPPRMRVFNLAMRADTSILRMPNLSDFARHVLKHNRIWFGDTERYRERSMWAALMPKITASAEYAYALDVVQVNNIQFASMPYAFYNRLFDGRIVWAISASLDLGRLIFSKERLPHWGRIERNQTAIRNDLTDRVHRLYLEYHRVARTLCFAPPADDLARHHLELRLEEIAAYLNAMSGGYWGRVTGSNDSPKQDEEGGS
jgi:photosystem II stability/assembly factor-like uncharacterized protein